MVLGVGLVVEVLWRQSFSTQALLLRSAGLGGAHSHSKDLAAPRCSKGLVYDSGSCESEDFAATPLSQSRALGELLRIFARGGCKNKVAPETFTAGVRAVVAVEHFLKVPDANRASGNDLTTPRTLPMMCPIAVPVPALVLAVAAAATALREPDAAVEDSEPARSSEEEAARHRFPH